MSSELLFEKVFSASCAATELTLHASKKRHLENISRCAIKRGAGSEARRKLALGRRLGLFYMISFFFSGVEALGAAAASLDLISGAQAVSTDVELMPLRELCSYLFTRRQIFRLSPHLSAKWISIEFNC